MAAESALDWHAIVAIGAVEVTSASSIVVDILIEIVSS